MRAKEFLTEGIRARIDHPEDLVWQQGSAGVRRACDAIRHIQEDASSVTIKWDGSPAVIFGREVDGTFIVTDKAGFNATKYHGRSRSANELSEMIYNRAPDQPGRKKFAENFANIFGLLESITPHDFRGFIQGDILFFESIEPSDGVFKFQPNKIEYQVPEDSDLGTRLHEASAGIVLHGRITQEDQDHPEPLTEDVLENKRLFVTRAETPKVQINCPEPVIENLDALDNFLLKENLKANKISKLPELVGQFISHRARSGLNTFESAPSVFTRWIYRKVSAPMHERMLWYINENQEGYQALWEAIQKVHNYKTETKRQIDESSDHSVHAYLKGRPGHEGYVAHTPHGKIKLVDRHHFMAEEKTVVFSFGRMNPITEGHARLVNKIRETADELGADALVFMSHTQNQDNPLAYEDKLRFARKAFGEIVHESDARGIMDVLNELSHKYNRIVYVAGDDRLSEFKDLLNTYNGKLYEFKEIDVRSAGSRDPFARGVEGMSATRLREYARTSNFRKFRQGLPEALQEDAREIMRLVKAGIKEEE